MIVTRLLIVATPYQLTCYMSFIEVSVTGWRSLIGCFKLQVILHKRATNYRALLQKVSDMKPIQHICAVT